MEVRWTTKSLERLHECLQPRDAAAATRTVQMLTAAPAMLLSNPRIGRRLETPERHEVRRLLMGTYELRYEMGVDPQFIAQVPPQPWWGSI